MFEFDLRRSLVIDTKLFSLAIPKIYLKATGVNTIRRLEANFESDWLAYCRALWRNRERRNFLPERGRHSPKNGDIDSKFAKRVHYRR
jgi:hypothetical protein